MWLFSCFKHDPSKDDIKTAKEISRYEEEDRRVREQMEIKRAKEKSLEPAEKEDGLEESNEKGKRKQVDVDQDDEKLAKTNMETFKDTEQLKHSKDAVKEDVNPPPPPSLCNDGKPKIGDGISVNPRGVCCLHCHKPIAMDEVSKKGKFHIDCYQEHRYPNCYVCKKKIPSTEEGIKYNQHPFWKEKYCPYHDDDGTAKCCSCDRLESFGTKYVMLADGRWLCRQCMECAVMDTDECHDLHVEIREFFEGLFLKVEKEFPLLLVEKQALNKAEEEEKIDYHHATVTRGLCMFEEQVVKKIIKGPLGPDKQLIDIVTERQWVTGCEVTGILILYGFPRLLTGYILAHEMMHAWLRLKGYRDLKLELEEGLCQALGLRWLESKTFASTDADITAVASSSSSPAPPAATTSKKSDDWSNFEKKFVEFCINQIKEDDSPVYGLGFKQVYQMIVSNNHSLTDTLKEIVSVSKAIEDSKF